LLSNTQNSGNVPSSRLEFLKPGQMWGFRGKSSRVQHRPGPRFNCIGYKIGPGLNPGESDPGGRRGFRPDPSGLGRNEQSLIGLSIDTATVGLAHKMEVRERCFHTRWNGERRRRHRRCISSTPLFSISIRFALLHFETSSLQPEVNGI
jgi:hypothetical protein